MTMLHALFGNETAAKILLYVENYDEGTPSGIARTFGMNKNRIYTQLLRLEAEGILVAKKSENLRIFSFNPRMPFKTELKSLLRKSLNLMPEKEFDRFFTQRRRPRRTGKEL